MCHHIKHLDRFRTFLQLPGPKIPASVREWSRMRQSDFFLGHTPSVRKSWLSRTSVGRGYARPQSERAMGPTCRSNRRTRTRLASAPIQSACQGDRPFDLWTGKTFTGCQRSTTVPAGHEVGRPTSSGYRQAVCGRPCRPQWQLRRVCSGRTRPAVHGYS